ncbi:Rv3654c family TadE-like protein [Streptomyces sp. NPDC058665]|uniref:Rv3654c family TadE-like protein n=1 Tax=Streptomyces sp. NPDC058665 TaxID=3346586 RepID=UPI00364BB9E8
MSRDRGSATVWAAMATTALCAVFAVVLAMGQAVVARHRAGSAADLAALAAAGHALRGAEAACARAAEVAGAQGAEVVRCALAGEIADVTARAGFGPYTPTARSRAGPPDARTAPAPAVGPARPRAGPQSPVWLAARPP